MELCSLSWSRTVVFVGRGSNTPVTPPCSHVLMYLFVALDVFRAQPYADDIDSLDAAFVPGTGWPEPGGLLPREAHKLVGGVAKEGLCGMELVEVPVIE